MQDQPHNNILFLDFDGVLNTGTPSYRDEFGEVFNTQAVEQLRHIVEQSNPKIIVSSSWKMLGFGTLREMWRERSLPGQIAGVTPSERSDEWLLTGMPPSPQTKGVEIQQWLDEHPYTHYAILDDEDVCLNDEMRRHWVQTNPAAGITPETVAQVLHLFSL